MLIRDLLRNLFRRRPTPLPVPPIPSAPSPTDATGLLVAVNVARERWGLPALAADTLLNKVATVQAAFCKQTLPPAVITHELPAPLFTRLAWAGVHPIREGEVLTRGATDAVGAVANWLLSPSHRDILLGDYVHAGAGRAGDVWCVVFVL